MTPPIRIEGDEVLIDGFPVGKRPPLIPPSRWAAYGDLLRDLGTRRSQDYRDGYEQGRIQGREEHLEYDD
jgi:hypothetical protein